jgi:hypothetical protein
VAWLSSTAGPSSYRRRRNFSQENQMHKSSLHL